MHERTRKPALAIAGTFSPILAAGRNDREQLQEARSPNQKPCAIPMAANPVVQG
ncbi:MAG: hypothetical protein LBC51_11450 [Treponema sp.]|nr:hypothetical protein [Treponema sp.]